MTLMSTNFMDKPMWLLEALPGVLAALFERLVTVSIDSPDKPSLGRGLNTSPLVWTLLAYGVCDTRA